MGVQLPVQSNLCDHYCYYYGQGIYPVHCLIASDMNLHHCHLLHLVCLEGLPPNEYLIDYDFCCHYLSYADASYLNVFQDRVDCLIRHSHHPPGLLQGQW